MWSRKHVEQFEKDLTARGIRVKISEEGKARRCPSHKLLVLDMASHDPNKVIKQISRNNPLKLELCEVKQGDVTVLGSTNLAGVKSLTLKYRAGALVSNDDIGILRKLSLSSLTITNFKTTDWHQVKELLDPNGPLGSNIEHLHLDGETLHEEDIYAFAKLSLKSFDVGKCTLPWKTGEILMDSPLFTSLKGKFQESIQRLLDQHEDQENNDELTDG